MRFRLFCVLASLLFAMSLYGTPVKRVFVLHSYSQEYGWTKLQHDSFVSSLGLSVDVSAEYLDTKRSKFTYEYETFFLHYLQSKYQGYRPDLIYVTDDNAMTFFLHHHSQLFDGVPVVFSGVNNLSLIKTLYPGKFTGVFERKEIVPNIELIRQFSPQTRDIWIVGDSSTTYQAIESDVKSKVAIFPHYTFHFLSSKRISDILKELPSSKKAFVILTTIGEWTDDAGATLTIRDSVARLSGRSHLVLCSMEDAYIVGGVIGGYVTSGSEQGKTAAALAVRYLKGEPLTSIHSVVKSPNVYMFDRNAMMKSRVILSEYTARNAIILYPEKSFLEDNQDLLINVAFLLFVAFVMFAVAVYFVLMEKKNRFAVLQSAFDDLSTESYKIKEMISQLEKNFHLGYWEWDSASDRLVCSAGLADILQIDTIEERGMEAFLFSVYPGDKERVEEMIADALKSFSTPPIEHRIIRGDGNIVSLVHTVRIVEEGGFKKAVGMVQQRDQ